ncbi:GNAT family N-acetyltransferase [Paenibacillus periandrae]|uniref:GNAT family N-acetyltransferase n=1 Tax=Paenibacillus periandrae TaxID=1761741 RepID=UPI001F09ADFC|nr:GNAT family N-acetyltransferase [Paenibacillus periandrae]
MNDLKLIQDYKHLPEYRLSFNELAAQVFHIDFEQWYKRGCWDDTYTCYSYIDGNTVVANLSVSRMKLVLNGQHYKGIQIGTVMTHPDYRSRGLSRKLLEFVLAEYEAKCDLMYLFANKSVLDFYPKFGFTPVREASFTMPASNQEPKCSSLRQLDVNAAADWKLIQTLAAERQPISQQCGVMGATGIFLWYCLNVFGEDIYLIEDTQTLVIAQYEDKELHVFDVISQEPVELTALLAAIVSREISSVHFHFTPQFNDIEVAAAPSLVEPDTTLFIRANSARLSLPSPLRFPLVAQA